MPNTQLQPCQCGEMFLFFLLKKSTGRRHKNKTQNINRERVKARECIGNIMAKKLLC